MRPIPAGNLGLAAIPNELLHRQLREYPSQRIRPDGCPVSALVLHVVRKKLDVRLTMERQQDFSLVDFCVGHDPCPSNIVFQA